MTPALSIRHRIAPLHSGSLHTGSAPACIVAPDRPPSPTPNPRAQRSARAFKVEATNTFDLMQSPGSLPANPRGTLYPPKSP